MLPTAVGLVLDGSLGELLDHDEFDLAGLDAPQSLVRVELRTALGRHHAAPALVDDVVLVADELTGNAERHAGGPESLTLEVREKGVAVGVRDQVAGIFVVRSPAHRQDELPESGRGLLLVESLATRWQARGTHDGKVVVAVFELAGYR